jgi:hypothetical protein
MKLSCLFGHNYENSTGEIAYITSGGAWTFRVYVVNKFCKCCKRIHANSINKTDSRWAVRDEILSFKKILIDNKLDKQDINTLLGVISQHNKEITYV